jgi:F-type H+-transporting ATPase subunit delta
MQIAKKYALLLFNEASKAQIQSLVKEEIVALEAGIFLRPEVAQALGSPTQQNKSEILLAKVMEKYRVTSLTKNFISLLVRLKRLRNLPSIVQEYNRLTQTADGSKLVDVISSADTSMTDRKSIEKLISSHFRWKTIVKYAVDPSLIGGILVKYDSVVLDASVKGALQRMLV